MTVSQFARSAVFEPETIQVMAGAYEQLLADLQLADRNDPFAKVVAKEVIEAARLGVRDAPTLRKRVLNALRKPH
jgi:hypothetical protein